MIINLVFYNDNKFSSWKHNEFLNHINCFSFSFLFVEFDGAMLCDDAILIEELICIIENFIRNCREDA
jgi:hypothetical protein